MNYTRVDWVDDKTPLSAANLNQMDSAIYALSGEISSFVRDGKINGGNIAPGTIQGTSLVDGSISNNKLADGAITDSKIADGAIKTDKLNNGAVETGKIEDSAITAEKIYDGAVTQGKISDGAVTSNKILDNAVTSSKILTQSVTWDKIGSGDAVAGKVLVSNGNGGAIWDNIPGSVTSISIDGQPAVSPINGVATLTTVTADYAEENTQSPAYIRNKPTPIPTVINPNSTKFLVAVPDSSTARYHYDWVGQTSQLPETTSADDGKVLTVVNGVWGKAVPTGGLGDEMLIGNWLIKSGSNGLTITYTDN